MEKNEEKICKNCGNDKPKKYMKFCCRKCTDEFKSKQNNEVRECLVCNTEFRVQKSNKKKICSDKCRREWQLRPETIQKQIESYKKTMQSNFGVDNSFQLEYVKDKAKETKIEKYNDKNYNNSNQMIETKLEKYGVTHHFKNPDMFQKNFIAQHKIYEFYFLEKMEEKGFLNEITRGKSYIYEFEGSQHTYHVDFLFKNKNIEIKSGWTYNENGKNKKLQDINETKWKTVIDYGDKLEVLIDKEAIDSFVFNL